MKYLWLKAFAPFVFCLTLSGCQHSQTGAQSPGSGSSAADSTPILLPVKVSGKWGYVNGTGQLVINPQFDYAEEFHEGRALVCLGKPCDFWDAYSTSPTTPNNSLWGFIDASGKVVVTPQYPVASAFNEGLAAVCTGDCGSKPTKPHSRGYINKDGKVVIPMQFGGASNFGSAQESGITCDWRGFGSLSDLAAAVAVAVEMWKPASFAGFQAPRAGRTVVAEAPSSRPRSVISIARSRFIGHSVENVQFGRPTERK